MQLAARRDVFAVPHGAGFIVYAPLAGRIVHANSSCVAQLRRYLETGDASAVDAGLVARLGGLGWLDEQPAPVPLPADRHYHPTMVTLFLTNRCNLRCTYCYAEAGERAPAVMPAEVARAAIDLVVRNARRGGRPPGIGFHGGGEPTVAWDALVGAVDHAHTVAGTGPAKANLGIATNGVMSPSQAEWVATTFPMVTLSFDGPADVHDAQRPTAAGTGSFDAVMAFVETLRAHGTPFTVRATITEANVARQAELVDFFVDATGCRQLHFEPVFASGRRSRAEGLPLAPDDFAAGFVAALDRAIDRGAMLRYSAARLIGTFLSFCGCAQDAFNVTPDGDITGCFEVCGRDNPLAESFYFGRYDPERGTFAIDMERLARLRELNVTNKPLCEGCLAKYTCAGDCPVKAGGERLDFLSDGPRCRMNQTITRALLERALDPATCRLV